MGPHRAQSLRYENGAWSASDELLTPEALLQIRVNGVPYTTTVRSPGHDELLARGLLFGEGLLPPAPLACEFEHVLDPETRIVGALDLRIREEHLLRPVDDRRSVAATASCGLCGVREAKDLRLHGGALREQPGEQLEPSRFTPMMERMAARQANFNATGGAHAAAAFTIDGELLAAHEDIGRHNAVDKVIGELIVNRTLATARCLTVSGRLSYEIVYKAFHAAIPILISVSAPSSMAVEMGERFGLTIVGFCRDGRATVYARPGRIVTSA